MWLVCIVARVCEILCTRFNVIYFLINPLYPHTLGKHEKGKWNLRLTHLCCCFVTQFSEFSNLYKLKSVLFSNHNRKPLEWPLMTTLEQKDCVLFPMYVTVSPHRRTTEHCRGINDFTTWGGGIRVFTEDPLCSLFQCSSPTIRIVKSAEGSECGERTGHYESATPFPDSQLWFTDRRHSQTDPRSSRIYPAWKLYFKI